MHFFSLLLKNLLRRPLRSILTMAGLAVAVATMVALVGVATGFERSFLQYYTQRGVDFVVQRSGPGTEPLNDGLPQQLGEQIAKVPGVKQVDARLVDIISFEKYNIIGVLINGWLVDSPLFDRLTVREGRRLIPSESRAVFMGRVLAAHLDKHVGDEIEIYAEPFKIVGIYESPTVFENGGVVVPLAELQRVMHRPNEVTGFSVVAEHGASDAELEAVQRRIEQVQPNLRVTRVADFVHNFTQIRICRATAWATSAIALVIGVIGMLNTMIMSVFERIHEIGLLRAIGWRNTRIAHGCGRIDSAEHWRGDRRKLHWRGAGESALALAQLGGPGRRRGRPVGHRPGISAGAKHRPDRLALSGAVERAADAHRGPSASVMLPALLLSGAIRPLVWHGAGISASELPGKD